MVDSVSPALARRIALAAQGFGRPLPESPRTRQVAGVVERLGLLQIDSVNVFERSHYLPAFSRIGDYDRALLDRLTTGRRGRMLEYWAHQAAFIPRELWPLFEFRREEYRQRGSEWGGWLVENRTLADWLRAELAANGPMPASDIEHDANERRGPWWGWSDVKRTLEWMFRVGEVVCVERRRFERVYALPEQALAPELLGEPPAEADAVRDLVGRAGAALGIATEADLADYWRMKRAPVREAIRDLEDAGELLPVEVPGWRIGGRPAPAWVHRDARRPRRLEAATVLSPFDPVVWFRPAHRAPLRLPLPHRDLHARARPQVRLLLAAGAHRRRRGGAGRPEERPQGGRAPGPVRLVRAGRAGRDRRTTRAGAVAGGGVAGPRRHRGRRPRRPRSRAPIRAALVGGVSADHGDLRALDARRAVAPEGICTGC